MSTWVKVKTQIPAHMSMTGRAIRGPNWAEIKNRNHLTKLLAEGAIEIPDFMAGDAAASLLASHCGVVVRGKKDADLTGFGTYKASLQFTYGQPALPYKKTLIWNPKQLILPYQVILGFSRLEPAHEYDNWDIVALLVNQTLLANQVGSPEDRAATKEIIGELRIPIYNPGKVWVKQSPKTERMVDRWMEWARAGVNEYHALIRAMYAAGKDEDGPLAVCTLPHNWMAGPK